MESIHILDKGVISSVGNLQTGKLSIEARQFLLQEIKEYYAMAKRVYDTGEPKDAYYWFGISDLNLWTFMEIYQLFESYGITYGSMEIPHLRSYTSNHIHKIFVKYEVFDGTYAEACTGYWGLYDPRLYEFRGNVSDNMYREFSYRDDYIYRRNNIYV